jgi:hypothetical protein
MYVCVFRPSVAVVKEGRTMNLVSGDRRFVVNDNNDSRGRRTKSGVYFQEIKKALV